MHQQLSLIATEGLSHKEIFDLIEDEKMIYIAQAHHHRDKREIQRRMNQLEMKISFDKKAGEAIFNQHQELQRRDELLDREFYGKY